MIDEQQEDDPHDDVTNWVGKLPIQSSDSSERSTERDTGRSVQPNVQRKEPPVETGRTTTPSAPD